MKKKDPIINRRRFFGITGEIAAEAAAGTTLASILSACSCPPPPPVVIDGFHYGVVYGDWTAGNYPSKTSWKNETYEDSQGAVDTAITTNGPFGGQGSLEISLDIQGMSETHRNGEVFVDLRYPPDYDAARAFEIKRDEEGKPLGVDLSGKILSATVFCPHGTAGSSFAPSGLQVYMKSMKIVDGEEVWSSFYGNWQNIWIGQRYSLAHPDLGNVIEGELSEIQVPVPFLTADGLSYYPLFGVADPGFNPENVALIGIKYGLNANSETDFKGKLWVDNFGWIGVTQEDDVNFSFEHTTDPITSLRNNGFNCASILQTEYMDAPDSVEIKPHPLKTHSDQEILDTIDEMHANGLMAILKPHVDVADDSWRGYIQPADIDAWFQAYTDFIAHYAAIAEDRGVEMLVMGTEFKSLIGEENRAYWGNVVAAVRAVYSGKLTYAANWDHYDKVCLWDLVDVVGIDAYFPLSKERSPSLQELVAGWSSSEHEGEPRNFKQELADWQKQVGKEIIFTELGYRSTDFAAREPWEYLEARPANQELQADCYKAVIEAFKDSPWFKGVHIWNWSPKQDYGGQFNTDFTPQHKLAERVFLE